MKDITKAKIYLSKARQILNEKAVKEDGIYKDRKYVKMAGIAAYAGVLVALDVTFRERTKSRRGVDWYTEKLSGMDKKILPTFLAAYDTLHLSMSCDGNLSAVVANEGLEMADKIINWAEQRT